MLVVALWDPARFRFPPPFCRARTQDARPGRQTHGQRMPRNCLFPCSLGTELEARDQPLPGREGDRFSTVAHAQLADHIRDMVVDRARTEEQALSDLRIGEVLAEETQDFLFAAGEITSSSLARLPRRTFE